MKRKPAALDPGSRAILARQVHRDVSAPSVRPPRISGGTMQSASSARIVASMIETNRTSSSENPTISVCRQFAGTGVRATGEGSINPGGDAIGRRPDRIISQMRIALCRRGLGMPKHLADQE